MTGWRRRILVIKLGALGDMVLATGPFAAIREAHADDEIVLLTTAPFAEFATQSGYFDDVWVDERPGRLNFPAIFRLRRRLRGGRFFRVYDLQTSNRSNWYFRLLRGLGRPQWSGIAWGCSHPHANHRRDYMHTIERQAEQLAMAGIAETPAPDLSWAEGDLSGFGLAERFVMMVPGAAAHRPAKRWPAENYAALAERLISDGVQPVIIGGAQEREVAAEITAATDGALSLAGETTLADLASLSRRAAAAIGNDTGPMHIAAICGCPAVVLYSDASDPEICRPRGASVAILQKPNLAELGVSEVADALSLR